MRSSVAFSRVATAPDGSPRRSKAAPEETALVARQMLRATEQLHEAVQLFGVRNHKAHEHERAVTI